MESSSLLESLFKELENRFEKELIAIYGVGSYFDENLPNDWLKNDIDIVIILKTLKSVEKKDWTTVRFERKRLNNTDLWIGFNTLQGLLDKETFQRESFSNYEWSVLELKYPKNSMLLYGKDIRYRLPEIYELQIDLDDILRRSLYHLNQSYKVEFRDKNIEQSMKNFTKVVFKFGFYLCIFYDENFHFTSIPAINKQVDKLVNDGKIAKNMMKFLEECMRYRRNYSFITEFHTLRTRFTEYVFSNLGRGGFHRPMKFKELMRYLENSFNGLNYLIQIIQKAKMNYNNSVEENFK